jgi:hypothetical protein
VKYGIVYSVLLMGLLSACGRAPQTTVTVPQPKVGETPLTEQYVKDNLQDYSKWLASTVVNSLRSSGIEKSPPAFEAQQEDDSDCGFKTNEGLGDVDMDSVPVNFQRTFVNCSQDKGFYIEVKNGFVHIQDAESGLRSQAKDLVFDFDAKNEDRTIQRQLELRDTWDFAVTKSGDSGALAYVLTMVATTFEGGNPTKTSKGTLNLAGVYSALGDGDLNDYDNGIINEAEGVLTLNDEAAFNAVIVDLQFSVNCQATPVSGSLNLDDGADNRLEIIFNGCETLSYLYNGIDMSVEPQQ